ncbi:hypothetical protein MGMO_141c00030 [Methyloglobulus morosus KoM1]|uniref:Peptidoglycan binding-like domain-containing protein n=1 Tax=Methyloglobulus morosus KoM1 TaxID=1116472 RepID=V5B6P0_9GAMM|nr:peptidoglycan-binding protein [Methyloglobulus morosus]ESS68920.1 hypothetical protein MGMO_141c00030 [Methyloglobulus morosus KoM1]
MSDLILTKPLKRGDKKGQVRLIQEWLSLRDEQVAIDGDFGPATEAAVKSFQNGQGLTANGIVDNATFAHLISPMTDVLKPITSTGGETLGELVVAYAKQHLAQHPREVGGQNRGPWVRLYMEGNEGQQWAWCAGFTCFCLKQACELKGVPLPINPSFSCDSLASSAKVNNRFVTKDKAGPGSFFLVRNTATDWTHTGIVIESYAEIFRSIEGNTNDEGSREGYEVCARTRGYKKMDFVKI